MTQFHIYALTGNKTILEKHIICLLPFGNNYYKCNNSPDNSNLIYQCYDYKYLTTFAGNLSNKYYIIPCPEENVVNIL